MKNKSETTKLDKKKRESKANNKKEPKTNKTGKKQKTDKPNITGTKPESFTKSYSFLDEQLEKLTNPNKRNIRKEIRNKIVDGLLNHIRKTWNMPDEVAGFVLKSIHFTTPIAFFIMFCSLPFKFAVLAIFPLLIAFIMFVTLNGCFLTIIEYKLWKQDINMIDPLIYICRDSPTPENRHTYTLRLTYVYTVVVLCILAMRYKLEKTASIKTQWLNMINLFGL